MFKSKANFKILSTKTKFSKYLQLPFNPKLKEKAMTLRKAGNLSEVLFWNKVKNKQLLNLDFERQKIIGNYIVDFYCAELGLIVEIDGESHNFKGEYDIERDKYLHSFGLKIIRVDDIIIKKDLDSFMTGLYVFVYELKQEDVKTPRPASCPPFKRGILTRFDLTFHLELPLIKILLLRSTHAVGEVF